LVFDDGVSTVTSATVTGLSRGVAYSFRVAALNPEGVGPSSQVISGIPASVPAEPGSLAAMLKTGSALTLGWVAPDDGGRGITDYVIRYSADGISWDTLNDGVSTSTSVQITGLTRGLLYSIRVKGVNAEGESTEASLETYAASIPVAPTDLVVLSKSQTSVSLGWGAGDDGGRAITDYRVEYSADGSNWLVFDDGVSTVTSATVTGLSRGVAYSFRVAALNPEGVGNFSDSILVTMPPARVTELSAVGKTATSVSLSWTAPTDGGQAISDYIVEYSANGQTWSRFDDGISPSTSATVTGLIRGEAYSFRIAAVNADGVGAWGSVAERISSGNNHSCAVMSDETARCWGSNDQGQLGIGSRTTPVVPVAVSGMTGVKSLALGASYSCAVMSDETARCWGYNAEGQLGNGSRTTSLVPAAVSGLTGVKSLALGALHSCAVMSDETARCWGYNAQGQLGNGSRTTSLVPVAVSGLTGVKSLDLGAYHSCAVMSDETVRCWGSNNHGQLGNGSRTTSLVAVAVSGLTGVKSLSSGGSHSCAVMSDETARCWGYNEYGQLGNGSRTTSSVPVAVSGLTGVKSLSSGSHSCAVMTDETARCWGNNSSGELGNGSRTDSLVPVAVWGLTGAKSLSVGESHSCAVMSDETARCWGYNSSGQLGNGSRTTSLVPVLVRDLMFNVIPAVVAGAPAVPVSSTHTTSSVSLEWNPPTDDGGRAIIDYLVEYSVDGSTWLTFPDGVSTSTLATVTELVPDRTYQFRISAVNTEGTGPSSQSISVTTVTGPSEPADLSVSSITSSSVSLTWIAPSADGGRAITDYRIQYSTDGLTWFTFVDGVSTSTQATVTGLERGTTYIFLVAGINAEGPGTSAGVYATPAVIPSAPREVRWISRDMSSVSLSWSAPADDGGTPVSDYRIQYSDDGVDWTTFNDGISAGTQATVSGLRSGTTYEFRVAAISEPGLGLFGTTAAVTPALLDSATGGFSGSEPARVFDTRPDQPDGIKAVNKAKVGGSYFIQMKLTDINVPGKGNIVPNYPGIAVSMNVTVTNPEGDGFVTVYPCGERPLASSLNYVAGQTIPNAVIAPVSDSGDMCFFSSQKTDLIVDVNGWFPPKHGFQSLSPRRIFDTRSTEAQGLTVIPKTKIGGNSILRVNVSGLPGAPMPSKATAISINLTVTNPEGSGFVTVYPCGDRPLASSLNYVAGQTIPNAVIAPISDSGQVCFYSSQRVDILADLNGWFPRGASLEAISPQRVFDTRASQSQGLRPVPKAMIASGGVLRVRVAGIPGVTPTLGIGAVSLNVTVTEPVAAGFVTVFPCGTRPNTSSLNFDAGQTIPNAVIAPVSAEGDVCFYASQPTQILADINGWYHK
jgi:alpha-tubulin suppressor-like RCC1 family protein